MNNRTKTEKNEILRKLWDNNKRSNFHIIRVPEGEKFFSSSHFRAEKVFEKIMAKDSSNLVKDTNLQIQEAEQTPDKINPKKSMPRHIIIKLLKLKTKKKPWEQPEKNNILPIGEHQFKLYQISHWKPQRQEWSDTFFKSWQERTVTCKFYTCKNILQE